MRDLNYRAVIERGRSPINDAIHDFLVPRISGDWLDIGCNAGWMLSDVPRGVGVEPSVYLVELAGAKGHTVHHAWAEDLPFAAQTFDTALMASVLCNVEDWRKALAEAQRVAIRVIGVLPYPGTPWGIVGGKHKWVRHVIDPDELRVIGARIEDQVTPSDYFFEI